MPSQAGGSKDPGERRLRGIEVEELGRLVREKRAVERLSVRQTAESAGVSFSTISRVEAGNQPDLATFLNLCAWLGYPPEHFYEPFAKRARIPTVDQVIKHLSADPRLSREAAGKISSVVRDLYAALAREEETPPTLALHLRASTIMRPGVPQRLAGILHDMREALEEQAAADAT